MNNLKKKIDTLLPTLIFIGIIAFITLLFVFFSSLSKMRVQKIHAEYIQETNSFIQVTKTTNPNIYELFHTARQYLDDCLSRPEIPISSCHSEIDINYVIDNVYGKNLSSWGQTSANDWSQTGFIVKRENNTNVYLLTVDGQFQALNPTTTNEVLRLMRGEVKELPWDNYSYYFQNKQFIVPIKDSYGEIIGGIIRAPIIEGN